MRNWTIILLLSAGLTVFLAGCYKDNDYQEAKLSAHDTDAHMFTDLPSIPADSFTVTRVIVTLPYDADSTKASVSFRTDLGFFLESGTQTFQITARQNIDSLKRIAIATLRGGTRTGTAHIQVSLYTQTKLLTVPFTNSYPDYVQFVATTLAVKPQNTPAGEIGFTCRLFRLQGSPSQLNPVTVQVVDSAFNHSDILGSFRVYNNLSDASGNTQFTYVLGDSIANNQPVSYIGRLYALVSVAKDANGDLIRDTMQFISSR